MFLCLYPKFSRLQSYDIHAYPKDTYLRKKKPFLLNNGISYTITDQYRRFSANIP